MKQESFLFQALLLFQIAIQMVTLKAPNNLIERPTSRASTTTSLHTTLNIPSRSEYRTVTTEALKDAVHVAQEVSTLAWGPSTAPDLLAYGWINILLQSNRRH